MWVCAIVVGWCNYCRHWRYVSANSFVNQPISVSNQENLYDDIADLKIYTKYGLLSEIYWRLAFFLLV